MDQQKQFDLSNLGEPEIESFKSGLDAKIKEVLSIDNTEFITNWILDILKNKTTKEQLAENIKPILENEEQTNQVLSFIEKQLFKQKIPQQKKLSPRISRQPNEIVKQFLNERPKIENLKDSDPKKRRVININRENKEEKQEIKKDIFERMRKGPPPQNSTAQNGDKHLRMDLNSIILKDQNEQKLKINAKFENQQKQQKLGLNEKRVIKLEKKNQNNQNQKLENRQKQQPDALADQQKPLSTQTEREKRMKRFQNQGGDVMLQQGQPVVKKQTTNFVQAKEGESAAPKKKIRCRHFPNCTISAEDCPYVHPTENCTYFPACNQGEKCLYLHPQIECKFGLQCTRQNCAYKHPKGRVVPGKINTMNPMMLMMQMMSQGAKRGAPSFYRGGFQGSAGRGGHNAQSATPAAGGSIEK